MTLAEPDVQEKSTRQRVVLLTTDRGQSIIGEMVDGKAKSIAYSPYGQQSAQQEVATRLGFNGQLREGKIGWYLLGNGYRAYNPRLMRFHSPDSWSPFGRGGLNAYMYCAGDPVNRSDPTGHIGDLIKFGWSELRKVASLGLSADKMARNTALRQAAALKRQAAMSALTANTGRSFPGDNPGSITNTLSGAFFEVSIGPSFTGSPHTPNSPHVHPNGVDPNKGSLSYGFRYGGVTSSGIGSGSGSGISGIGGRSAESRNSFNGGRRHSSRGLPTYDEAMLSSILSYKNAFAESQRGKTFEVNHMAVNRPDNLGAAAPYQAPAVAPQVPPRQPQVQVQVQEHDRLMQGLAELNHMQRDVIQQRAAAIRRCEIL